MADIDVGPGANAGNGNNGAGNTVLSETNLANGDGILNTFEVMPGPGNIIGFKMGTFYISTTPAYQRQRARVVIYPPESSKMAKSWTM